MGLLDQSSGPVTSNRCHKALSVGHAGFHAPAAVCGSGLPRPHWCINVASTGHGDAHCHPKLGKPSLRLQTEAVLGCIARPFVNKPKQGQNLNVPLLSARHGSCRVDLNLGPACSCPLLTFC